MLPRFVKSSLKVIAALLALIALGIGIFAALTWAPDRPVESLKTRWAASPSQFVMLQGMNVHLRDEGPRDDREPIVLIHGTSASLHTWDGWAATLSKTRRVIRFDLPGFGLTGPNANDDYRVETYGAFVHALLDQLGVQQAIIGGNSLGGHVAMVAALQRPERVTRLILVDASGYPLAPTSVPIGFKLSRVPLIRSLSEHVLPRVIVENSVKDVFGDTSRVTPELVDRYYEITLREGNRRALRKRMELVLGDAITERIPSIKIPTLILWGGKDRLIPLEAGRRFATDIKGSQLVVFDALGHVPQEEDPEVTVRALEAFLNRVPGK
jgi:pimeloyl-ACP methyl ester carboxylesterase